MKVVPTIATYVMPQLWQQQCINVIRNLAQRAIARYNLELTWVQRATLNEVRFRE